MPEIEFPVNKPIVQKNDSGAAIVWLRDTEKDKKPQKQIKSLLIVGHFNVAAFDNNGQQIPELQKSLLSLLAEHIQVCGYDPETVIIETQWWDKLRIFKTSEGFWNYELL